MQFRKKQCKNGCSQNEKSEKEIQTNLKQIKCEKVNINQN